MAVLVITLHLTLSSLLSCKEGGKQYVLEPLCPQKRTKTNIFKYFWLKVPEIGFLVVLIQEIRFLGRNLSQKLRKGIVNIHLYPFAIKIKHTNLNELPW